MRTNLASLLSLSRGLASPCNQTVQLERTIPACRSMFSFLLLALFVVLTVGNTISFASGPNPDPFLVQEARQDPALLVAEFTAPSPLPNPIPFLGSQPIARQDPIFEIADLISLSSGQGIPYQQPSFQVGNKSVVVRKIDGIDRLGSDQAVSIYISDNEVGRFVWWGHFAGGESGYPFGDIPGDPESLEIDESNQKIIYTKPYLTPEGERVVFKYEVASLTDSRVSISWDMGITDSELNAFAFDFSPRLWFISTRVRGKQLTTGEGLFAEATREVLVAGTVKTSVFGDFDFVGGSPSDSFKVEFGSLAGDITESLRITAETTDRYDFVYRSRPDQGRQAQGEVIVDLGGVGLAAAGTPPPVGGIDFLRIDNTHVPLSSVRNIMPNSSFEQGLRYWKWADGGALYTPDVLAKYDIVPEGLFGKNALIIRSTQPGAPPMRSMPLSLETGQAYTLSFYAKAEGEGHTLRLALAGAAKGGQIPDLNGPFGDLITSEALFTLTPAWQRYQRTFTADSAGLSLLFVGGGNTLIDGIQLEKENGPTAFVAPPLDGLFTTGDQDNSITKGNPIDAGFTFTGEPGTEGFVFVSVKNAFSEVLYSEVLEVSIGQGGIEQVALSFDANTFGEGIFVVQAKYQVDGFENYYDYYRFFIMTPLSNTHATKDIFGIIGRYARISRGEDLAEKYMEWGFGSTSWGYAVGSAEIKTYLEKKYKIANYVTAIISEDREINANYKTWTSITPEMEDTIEELAYQAVSSRDTEHYRAWTFGNEEEAGFLPLNGEFNEYFKAQHAVARGAKRADPNTIILPTMGTSGYSLSRGSVPMEGYLQAAQDNNFRYDAIAVHPYGNIDKGTLSVNDLDDETARLIEQMARFGYGEETPIYYTEFFNVPETYIPQWNANASYDLYASGKATYDFGNREFIQAASLARAHIIMLKYWPHVQSANAWISKPYLDQNLTPLIVSKSVNTLGTLFGDVEYIADIKPFSEIRGYVFRLEDGTAIAALWCIDQDVENGFKSGPRVNVSFAQSVEFYDLMGNQRFAEAGANGVTEVQLTPAPLMIKAANVNLLAERLQNMGLMNSSVSSPRGISILKKRARME